MTIDTTSFYDSLTQASTASTVNITTDAEASSLTSTDFMTLLVTELEYQDPTEPMDNTEMVNQLTQYSQLDELAAMNEKMDALTESLSSMTASNGLDYLGKQVEAQGYTVNVSNDDVSTLFFNMEEEAAALTCNIYDETGSIVDTQTYSNISSGDNSFTWDGTDYNGNTVDDGNYAVLITAQNSNGANIDVSTTTTGTVTGISSTDEGVILTLADGRTVNMADVTYATS